MTRKTALESLNRLRNKGFHPDFKEEKSGESIYICVIHHANTDNDTVKKEMIRRIMKGEEVVTAKGKVYIIFGYGKLLGINPYFNANIKKYERQLVLYDFVYVIGNEHNGSYNIFHEAWAKLGEWFLSQGFDKLKERIVFS